MQTVGIVFVKVDGQLHRTDEGAKLFLGGKERETRMGPHWFSHRERLVPSRAEFAIVMGAGEDLIGLQDKTDAVIEYITDTGDTYMVSESVCLNPTEFTGGEGLAPFVFEGTPAQKV